MDHLQEYHTMAYIEIDPVGDMYAKIVEHDAAIGCVTTLLRVSRKVLADNSAAFKEHLESTDEVTLVEQRQGTAKCLEIWFRILHNTLDENHYLGFTIDEVQRLTDLANLYSFKINRMSVRFAFWLGQQDLRSATSAILNQLGQMCQTYSHQIGAECISHLLSSNSTVPEAFSLFPPIPAMSMRQISQELLGFATIATEDYSTWAFSSRFLDTYGKVTECYSDFYRLVTTPFDRGIVPTIEKWKSLDVRDSRFLHFCKSLDESAAARGHAPVGRKEMEASWACLALSVFETSYPENQGRLRHEFRMRFHPERKLEQYWSEKAETLGWAAADVARMGDHCDEAEHEIAEPDDDDDEKTEATEQQAGCGTALDGRFGHLGIEDAEAEAEDEAEALYGGMSTKELMNLMSGKASRREH